MTAVQVHCILFFFFDLRSGQPWTESPGSFGIPDFPGKGGQISWKECFKVMHPDGEMDHQMHPE